MPGTAARSERRDGFPAWEKSDLAAPPVFHVRQWTALIGPGILMAGANIGGGEWLFGPLVTAQYGGQILWLATVAILLQVFHNLGIMRYALYCGEPIFVGFFRTPPGPGFWTFFYIVVDFGSLWPYLSANAAVAIAAVILGRLPGTEDDALIRGLSYAVFLSAFVPLIFGGKIYNSLLRVMVAKLILVFGYLTFIAIFFVSWDTKAEILSGLFRFGSLPEGDVSWATLAAFAAVSGAGGLTNIVFSNHARDKGWGMGSRVGAIPSAVGGKTIRLSHTGKTFEITAENLQRWKGWLAHIRRDQLLWGPACVLGMVLPAMLSYEFIRGIENVDGNAVAAMTADAVASRYGGIFWILTLLCGFTILYPTQISTLDAISRRWTDVLWVGWKPLRKLEGNQVKYVYYGILAVYGLWGLIALKLTPNPLVLAIATGVLFNLAMAVTALHVLYVNLTLLPGPLRPGWLMRAGSVSCAVFYFGITWFALQQQWPRILAWLGR
ncbi:MAG: Nramp family divalent metal transporter [Bryobacteraceae bacterium]